MTFVTAKTSKALVNSFNVRLGSPIELLIKNFGYIKFAVVAYLYIFLMNKEFSSSIIYWTSLFWFYQLFHNYIRKNSPKISDNKWYLIFRVLINLILTTWILIIFPEANFLLFSFFLIPIFLTSVFFPKNRYLSYLLLIISLIILEAINNYIPIPNKFDLLELFVSAATLILASIFLVEFLNNSLLQSKDLAHKTESLYKSLELTEIVQEISETVKKLTISKYSLVIIIDPEIENYIYHHITGWKLKSKESIIDLANRCNVFQLGKGVTASKLEQTEIGEYLINPPESLMFEPVKDKAGRVIGAICVGDHRKQFYSNTALEILRQYCIMAGGAIENSLNFRKLAINNARNQQISKELLDTRDTIEDITSLIVDEAIDRVEAATGAVVHLLNHNKEKLLPTAENFNYYGLEKSVNILSTPFKIGRGIAGNVLKSGYPIRVNDAENSPLFERQVDNDVVINSILVVPLMSSKEKKPFGTISIISDKVSAFTHNDEIIMSKFSQQCELAINNTQKIINFKMHGSKVNKTLDLFRSLDFENSLDNIYLIIAKYSAELLGFKLSSLSILDHEKKEATRVSVYGLSDKESKERVGKKITFDLINKFLKEEYLIGRCYLAESGNDELLDIISENFYIAPESLDKQIGWNAYDILLAPLYDQNEKMFGIISLDLPLDGMVPSPELIEAVSVFASTAAWFLEIKSIRDKLKYQEKNTKLAVNTIIDELATSQDLNAISQVVVQVGANLLNAEGCSIYLVDDNSNYIELKNSNYSKAIGRHKPISAGPESGLSSYVAATGNPIISNNLEYKNHLAWAGEVDHLEFISSGQCRSLLMVPIHGVSNKKIVGVLKLENKLGFQNDKGFTEHDKMRLEDLAQQVAIALEVVNHYEYISELKREGLEDDLHELINWYHSGVYLHLDLIDEWLESKKYKKARDHLRIVTYRARTTLLELKTLHTTVTNNIFQIPDIKIGFEKLVEAWSKRVSRTDYSIPIEIKCPKNLKLPDLLRNTLLKITSNAISNSINYSGILHSKKVKIKIWLSRKNDEVTLRISDNGIGASELIEGYGISRIKQLITQLNKSGLNAKIQFNYLDIAGFEVIANVNL